MNPPSLDFTSELFDPYTALHSKRIKLPYPNAKTYNNIAEYYSLFFLKKTYESLKPLKHTVKPRERNYDWYYDTLGLSEYQRHFIQSTKKIKKRKGKKPISIVTIPGSPLKSEKVTVCKSDFKEYCQRKYRTLNTSSPCIKTESAEFKILSSNRTPESSSIPIVIKTEPLESALKLETSEFSPTSYHSTENNNPFSFYRSIKSESELGEFSTTSHIVKSEFPSTVSVTETRQSDSSNDSFTDEVLILKMKSNIQKACTLKNIYKSPVSLHIKKEPLALPSKSKHSHVDLEYLHDPHQATDDKKNSKSCSSSDYQSINSSSALNDSKSASSLHVKNSSILVNNKKKKSKKSKSCSDGEIKSQSDHKTSKHKKKQKSKKNKDDNLNTLESSKPQKSTTQNIHNQKKCALLKENSSVNDSKSVEPIKKCCKSSLKENMLSSKKLSTTIKVNSKRNNKVSKVKTEDLSATANHCTCKFPCGLSHLCTCGFFASAKEVLSKFKIPRKKK